MRRSKLLGVDLDLLTEVDIYDAVDDAIRQKRRIIIGNHNLHSVHLTHKDAEMRRFFELCTLSYIDGMPLVYWGKLLGRRIRREHRLTHSIWTPALIREATRRRWRVYHLGCTPAVNDEAIARLRRRHRELAIAGHHGFFDASAGSEENRAVIAAINRFRPHYLMVGMGMPRQERWIVENHVALDVNAIHTCGAAMVYVAGAKIAPPAWMSRIGFEWAFRLATDPRRLARRYLVEPVALTPYLWNDLRQSLSGRWREDVRQ